MDPITIALVGAGIKVLADHLSNRNPPEPSTPDVDATAKSEFDEYGECCEVFLQTDVPDGTLGSFRIVDKSGDWVKGAEGFCDDDGDFVIYSLVKDNKCKCYIPHSAPRVLQSSDCFLVFSAVEIEGGECRLLAQARFQQEFNRQCEWDYGAYWLPLIQLCFYVCTTDRSLSSEAVRATRQYCRFGESPDEKENESLRMAMKIAHREIKLANANDIYRISKSYGIRFPHISGYETIQMLLLVCKSNGALSQNQVELMRKLALLIGLTNDEWEMFSASQGLNVDEYLKILNVSATATRSEIRAAYLREIRIWHPDRFVNATVEEQSKAESQTRKLRVAYEALVEWCVDSNNL